MDDRHSVMYFQIGPKYKEIVHNGRVPDRSGVIGLTEQMAQVGEHCGNSSEEIGRLRRTA
jgi:hypothetical protein